MTTRALVLLFFLVVEMGELGMDTDVDVDVDMDRDVDVYVLLRRTAES